MFEGILTGSEVVHECRRCGTAVSSGTDQCPHCGTDSIACYRVE
ncbi:hypothetical protein [Haloarcula salinisoli]|nr:hypothetical protein [Halomicroarcula salinisoli]